MQKNRAFTLIELLVVISIIGILASAVMLRYPLTIRRVKDSRVVTSLTQFRVQAAVLKDSVGDYSAVSDCNDGGACQCEDVSLKILCQDVQDNAVGGLTININDDDSGYCAIAYLAEYDEHYFCIDHHLKAKKYLVSPPDCAIACQAANSCSCE